MSEQARPSDESRDQRTTSQIRSDAVRGTWWTAINAVVGMPLSVLANLVVARTLGPEGFGVLAAYLTAYSLLLVVTSAGIGSATIQWGAAAFARGNTEEFDELARRCAGLNMLCAGPAGAVVAFIILHDESWSLRLAAGAAVAVTVAVGAANVVLTAMAMNARLAVVALGFGVAIQASVVTAAVASGEPGPVWLARLLVTMLLSMSGLAIADPRVRRACLRPLLRWPWPSGYAWFSWTTLASTMVGTLVFSRTEVLILNGSGNAVAAGLFALAAGFALQITAPIDAMLGPLLPSAAALLAVDRERAAHVVVRGLRLSAFITTPVLVLAVPIVSVLTPLVYGRQFFEAGYLFVALAVVSCVQTVLHPVTAFTVALRKPLTVFVFSLVALVCDVALVLVLLDRYGAYAAVVGNCVGQLLVLGGTVVLVHRLMSVDLRACAGSMGAFTLNSVVTAAAGCAGLRWLDSGAHPLEAVVAATIVSIVGAAVILRVIPNVLRAEDVAPVERTFPERTAPLLRWLRRLGYLRD